MLTIPEARRSHPLHLIRRYLYEAVQRHQEVLHGQVLDVGCGRQPYRSLVEGVGGVYLGYDLPRPGAMAHVLGTASALPFAENSFDAVLCTEVLEHLPAPQDCLREVARVLRPGGHALVTCPWLWGPHEVPYDFYRYTEYGLRYLTERAKLGVVSIEKTCGILAALGQRLSAGLHLRLGRGKPPGPLLGLTYATIHFTFDTLDRWSKHKGEPLGYVLLAVKE